MYIKPWEELTIRDDYMFKLIMRRKHICQRMLERILRIKIRDIRYIESEKSLNMQYAGKGVRLDVYVADDHNTVYNVEMQVNEPTESELAKRTRYYQSVIDLDLLEAGQDYEELNDTFIIFICPFEPFKKGRHIYTFRNTCQEDMGLVLKDGTTKIFLNAVGTENDVADDVKAFLNYVNGVLSDDTFVQEIDREIREVKTAEQERVGYMTFAMRLHEERKAGRQEGKLSMVEKMLQEAAPIDFIERVSGWTKEQILAVKQGGAPKTES